MNRETQLQHIKVPKEKSTSLFHKYGNTVVSTSLINLHEMIDSGRLKRGMRVVFIAHGAETSGSGLFLGIEIIDCVKCLSENVGNP